MEVMRFLFSLEFLRMAVLWTLSLVFSYLNLNFAAVFRQSKAYSRLPLQPSSQPPICIVTGATSGLGAAAAKYLSKEGYYVILAGRSSDLLSKLRFDEKTVFGKHLKHLSRRPIRYPFVHIYEHSKLFLLLFSYELHRQLFLMDPSRHISVMAADPGVVKTAIMREIPWNVSQIAFSVLRFLRLLQSPEEGIDSIVDAAFAPQEASGQYFFGGRGRTVKSSPLSNDAKLAKKLWATTSELLFQSGFKI